MAKVPTYLAFLRAINLGPTRQFPKTAIIAAVEGAVGLCQTRRSVEPLDRVIAELASLCDAAVDRV